MPCAATALAAVLRARHRAGSRAAALLRPPPSSWGVGPAPLTASRLTHVRFGASTSGAPGGLSSAAVARLLVVQPRHRGPLDLREALRLAESLTGAAAASQCLAAVWVMSYMGMHACARG